MPHRKAAKFGGARLYRDNILRLGQIMVGSEAELAQPSQGELNAHGKHDEPHKAGDRVLRKSAFAAFATYARH